MKPINKEIDEIYDAIDALSKSKCWIFLNEYFENLVIRSWRIEIDKLLAYATASFPAKSKIPKRKSFISNCKRLHPDEALWKDLE